MHIHNRPLLPSNDGQGCCPPAGGGAPAARPLRRQGPERERRGVVGEEEATGLPLIPTLPPVLGPGVQLPPVPGVPGLPPARKTDNKSP